MFSKIDLGAVKSFLYQNFRQRFPFNKILEQENENLNLLISSINIYPDSVLDIGIGHGNALIGFQACFNRMEPDLHKRFLKNNQPSLQIVPGFPLIIGIDNSWPMIKYAQRAVKAELLKGNGCHLPFKNQSLALILAIGIIEYLPDVTIFFQEVCRVLRKNGCLIVTFSPWNFLFFLRFLLGNRLYFHSMNEFELAFQKHSFRLERKLEAPMQIQYLLKKYDVSPFK